ncbi:MAG: FeoB-associated Cys-rich membrane protein [Ruminiclostridium sp.]|nr:FeoB-associated Cys-rich membrane protein [Ruminiclostridium sp.]
MDNFVVIAVIVAVIASVVLYIVKAKKSGIKCIGCPDAKTCQARTCGGNCQGCKGCGGHIDPE